MRRLPALLLPLLAAFALIAAQCGGNGKPLTSGIEGLVTIGPMCPVEQIDTPCPDQPYQATIVVKDHRGVEVERIESGEDGTFSVALAPSEYTLLSHSYEEGGVPYVGEPHVRIASEQQVEVREGLYTHVEVQFDSGIR